MGYSMTVSSLWTETILYLFWIHLSDFLKGSKYTPLCYLVPPNDLIDLMIVTEALKELQTLVGKHISS